MNSICNRNQFQFPITHDDPCDIAKGLLFKYITMMEHQHNITSHQPLSKRINLYKHELINITYIIGAQTTEHHS